MEHSTSTKAAKLLNS